MRSGAFCCLAVCIALLAPLSVHAGVLVAAPNLSSCGSNYSTPCSWYEPVGPYSNTIVGEQANQFSLASTAFVTTIDFTLVAFTSGDPFTMSLRSSLTGSDIATFNVNGANVAPTLDSFSVTLNQSLAAGTYYLVLSSTVYDGGWILSDDTLVQNAGTVTDGIWFSGDGGSTWNFDTPADLNCQSSPGSSACGPFVFAVNGSSAVPEPATLLLLGSGMAVGALKRRKA